MCLLPPPPPAWGAVAVGGSYRPSRQAGAIRLAVAATAGGEGLSVCLSVRPSSGFLVELGAPRGCALRPSKAL